MTKKKVVEVDKEIKEAEVTPGLFELTGSQDSPLRLKRGQRFSKRTMLNAIRSSNGLLSVAAKRLGCSRATVHNYLDRYPDLQQEVRQIREAYVDLAESSLLKQVNEKNTAATIFLLKCLGKQRGWVESPNVQLHAHVDGSGTWADIMKRVASKCSEGRIVPTKEEIARVVGSKALASASACRSEVSACAVVEAVVEDEVDEAE